MATLQTRINFPIKKKAVIQNNKTKSTHNKTKSNVEKSFNDNTGISKVEESIILEALNSENASDTLKITPTKRKDKNCNNTTDVTPPKLFRYNGDLKNTVSPKTPSTLLAKLEINSPRSSRLKSAFTPKKLFETKEDKYLYAKQALHSSVPVQMPGREKELKDLQNFINNHLQNGTSGTLYISGPPGTGKTAALMKIFTDLEDTCDYKQVYINCTAVRSAQIVYSKIAKELCLKTVGKSEKSYLTSIENYLASKHKTIILVLDEVDQLDSKRQSVLYTIFEWPSIANSRLILIGIANALDLTDRILPRLQSRCELKPKLMHFAPYNKQQIVQIISQRLASADVSEIFSPVAVQMLAAKVASVSGDVRRALDISRRVIELAEERRMKQKSDKIEDNKENLNLNLNQVVTVLNNVYGTSQNLQEDVDETVPLQQKLLICALLLMLKKGKSKDVTVGKLHETYRKVCNKRNLLAVDQSEFVGLCSLIETRGIIKIQGRKEPRFLKVCLEWDEDEVNGILKDKQLMSSILQDESVLSK